MALAARLISGMFTPLIDQASASSARLLRKLALFVVATVACVVVLIALTVAFDLWIASAKGPIVGALAVAGVYFIIAAICVILALRRDRPSLRESEADTESGAAKKATESQIDDFAAPLLGLLERLGLRKEQLAVLAGTSVAKQIGPVPLVGLAIVAGFLIGRMWRGLFSTDLVATLLASDLFSGLFSAAAEPSGEDAGKPHADQDAA